MAIINKTGIGEGNLIEAEHVTRAIDALSGGSMDSIVATGSFTGSFTGDGAGLTGITVTSATSASYAETASYLTGTVTSASYATSAVTASYVMPLYQTLTVTGSVILSGSAVQLLNELDFKSNINFSTGGSFNAIGYNKASLRIDGSTVTTLADGSDGQILYIYCTQVVTPGTNSVTPTNAQGFTTVDFTTVGNTATLMFITNKWYIMSLFGATNS